MVAEITEPVVIRPLMFSMHAHALGRMVSGYWLPSTGGRMQLIGEHDPRDLQIMYPVVDPDMVIRQGDLITGRCLMNNTRDHDVYSGQRRSDEMCAYFLLYYVDGDTILRENQFISVGAPAYRWANDHRVQRLLRD